MDLLRTAEKRRDCVMTHSYIFHYFSCSFLTFLFYSYSMVKNQSKKNDDIVNIHGKDYMTVAGRLKLAHDVAKRISIHTEVVPVPDQVVVRATVTTEKGTYTGISAANPAKVIERQSPYEVAETSAVGRALGFAGYGTIEGIATADEIRKAEVTTNNICTCGTKNQFHAVNCPARS